MTNQDLNKQIELIPHEPGVYKYYNESNKIIYIGKAKDLKKRVQSYFTNYHQHNSKTKLLISQIAKIEYIIVNSEHEAFLLENNLIKENQPKYNINLKDDKSYPWICISKEEYPRIYFTRRYNEKKGEYYGPYTSKDSIKKLLQLIRRFLPYRTCKLQLTQNKIKQQHFQSCLYYQLKQCGGPCINSQSYWEYNQTIQIIKSILKGNINQIIHYIQEKQQTYIDDLHFERAEYLEHQVQQIKQYIAKNQIINPKLGNFDIITLYEKEHRYTVNYMQIRDGAIILSINKSIYNPLQLPLSELLTTIQYHLNQQFKSSVKKLLTNITYEPLQSYYYQSIEIPQRGEKHKLIQLSLLNAKRESIQQIRIKKNKTDTLSQIQKELGLPQIPYRIECIDNSNLQGTHPVSACVVFINGKPSKNLYRRYSIQTIKTPDDYQTMKEVINRRYSKLPSNELPNLLILDGGKGQLTIGLETLKKIYTNIPFSVISLAEKKEEIYTINHSTPLLLGKRSKTLQLIMQIRNEAHRFGLQYHQRLRDKNNTLSELQNIKGIGIKSIQILYNSYHSLKEITKNGQKKLYTILGPHKGKLIWDYLQSKYNKPNT